MLDLLKQQIQECQNTLGLLETRVNHYAEVPPVLAAQVSAELGAVQLRLAKALELKQWYEGKPKAATTPTT